MTIPTAGRTYFTDNGAMLCFDHLGASARATGRDTSGQEIEELDADATAAMAEIVGHGPLCETCRTLARRTL